MFGYPAFVAGSFCIASLGIVFPAVGRAVQGFLALWMWAALWMMATTGPIALFLALSHWMLDQLPLALQIAVLLLWGALLTAAISLIATETSRTRLYTALRPIGALAPLVYTFNVLWIAMVFFALATCLLTGADLTVLWHLLDEVPLLSINKTLHWNEPLEYRGWVGPFLLLFKVAVIGPAITAFAFYAGRPPAEPAPEMT
jgi:hypothetical protein